ncbi:ABC transporter permease [Mesorhizobium sp. BR1-1-16]|uniref:ABC transporter permease n=1 Tax=Mesorhizobium sp. BR1-1-16 TaxID=2876653 RepID=UPI001CCD16BE|nr:ABC transporter permease [Mesorhizobium sp. BR1-1-16]MBZ9935628.1 ABC transporter permease [Mesorhizobium sp. BR1-1-16]
MAASSRLRALSKPTPAAIGAAIVLLLAALAVLAPYISPYDSESMDFNAVLSPPSLAHLFGTDNFGRDVLTRALFGLRVSLIAAIGSVAAAMVVGVPLGLLAGYRRGFVDAVIMRPVDVIMAFPAIVLVVALAGVFRQSLGLMTLAIGFVYFPIIVRVMRGAAIEVSDALFVEGARARGASRVRIMARHVLPNAITPVLVQASALMGVAILMEAAISFIGLGVQPPTPSLGLMLSDGRSYMGDAPWLVICPGLGILVAVLGFNLMGDGLPRLLDAANRRRK